MCETQCEKPHDMRELSPNEYKVIRYIAAGFPRKSIAQEMHISHRTIEQYTYNIRLKWNARDMAHAVAKGLAFRFFRFDDLHLNGHEAKQTADALTSAVHSSPVNPLSAGISARETSGASLP